MIDTYSVKLTQFEKNGSIGKDSAEKSESQIDFSKLTVNQVFVDLDTFAVR